MLQKISSFCGKRKIVVNRFIKKVNELFLHFIFHQIFYFRALDDFKKIVMMKSGWINGEVNVFKYQ